MSDTGHQVVIFRRGDTGHQVVIFRGGNKSTVSHVLFIARYVVDNAFIISYGKSFQRGRWSCPWWSDWYVRTASWCCRRDAADDGRSATVRWDIVAMSSRGWSRSKCLLSDFDKATFGRIANANSNGGSVNVSIASVLAAAEDKQRGSVDDPLDNLREVVTNGLWWLALDDWLEDDIAMRICHILSGSTEGVYERCHHFRVMAKCIGDLIA